LPGERQLANGHEGTPVPDSKAELPPVIRRTEVVAIALVGLLVICIIAGLYLAKAFFLPITMAFIVGTMLSPAASFLERCRIPRALAAVLIVATAGAGVTFMVGMIASPAVEWSGKLPELGALLKEKLHVFDRSLALWQQLQSMLGGPGTLTTVHLPKIDWVQPTLEFLSPTFAEFLLFAATLILFIASWRDLRRALIMNFGERTARHAQSGRPWRASRDPEFHPDHRSGGDVRRPGRGRPGRVPEHRRRTVGTGAICGHDLPGRSLPHPHDRRPPAGAERARRVHRARVLDLAVGPDGRVPVVAAPDRRADREGAFDAARCAATAGGLADVASGTSPSTGRLIRK
jgi:hypothetical protein